MIYRKIPKISPGAYIFQRPFVRGLFLEDYVSKSARLILGGKFEARLHSWKEIYVSNLQNVFTETCLEDVAL